MDIGLGFQYGYAVLIYPLQPRNTMKGQQVLETYLRSLQTYIMEPFCRNSKLISAVNYFHKKASPEMFDRVLNTSLTQQTFQRRLNVVFRLIWRGNVAQRQINVETTLCTSTL